MPLTISRSVEQVVEPIDLSDVKVHIKVSGTTDDDIIYNIMLQVRDYIETVLNRQLNTATLIYAIDEFPTKTIFNIPRPPLQSITSIIYSNTDNVLTTLATTEYGTDTLSEPGRVYLLPDKAWPSTYNIPNAVKITYQAGYASAAAVPRRIKLLMLLMIADLYKYRGAISIEDFIDSLPYLKSLLWSARNIEIY